MNWPCTAADRLLALIIASVRRGVWRPLGTGCDQRQRPWPSGQVRRRAPPPPAPRRRTAAARSRGPGSGRRRRPGRPRARASPRRPPRRSRHGRRGTGPPQGRPRRGRASPRPPRGRRPGRRRAPAWTASSQSRGPSSTASAAVWAARSTRRQSHSSGARALGDARRWPGNDSKTELRQRQALAEAANDDDVVGQAERRRERGPVPERRLVRLVRHDEQAVSLRARGRRRPPPRAREHGRSGSRGCRGAERSSAIRSRPRAPRRSQRHPSAGLVWTYTGVAPAARIGPSKKKHGAGTTTSSPGRRSERKQSASACIAPFVTTSSAPGSTARPVDRRSSAERHVAQLDEPAGRRCGHRPRQHSRDGLDDVVGQRGRRRPGQRDRLDSLGARLRERALGLVGGEPAAPSRRRDGQQDMRRVAVRVQDRLLRPPPCACRCRRPRRCSGCARSGGSSSS